MDGLEGQTRQQNKTRQERKEEINTEKNAGWAGRECAYSSRGKLTTGKRGEEAVINFPVAIIFALQDNSTPQEP